MSNDVENPFTACKLSKTKEGKTIYYKVGGGGSVFLDKTSRSLGCWVVGRLTLICHTYATFKPKTTPQTANTYHTGKRHPERIGTHQRQPTHQSINQSILRLPPVN